MSRLDTIIVAVGLVTVQLALPSPAGAQRLQLGGSESNFGAATLSSGFTPDPHQVTITSGGGLNVRDMNLGSGCVGYATTQPDFILHLNGNPGFLRFYNEGNGDTGLLINDPSGTWLCDDDSHTGNNPMVTITDASAGQYDVWVTSYSSEDNIRGTLHITELNSNPSGAVSSGGTLNLGGSSSNYGSATLSPGFTPDPHEVSVTSGGSLNVREMNLGAGCVGFATRDPDFIMHLAGDSRFLRFYSEGDGDTGLVINDPNGTWHCDDDSHTGTNPMVDIENANDGQYDVWVTSYSSDDNISGTLHITELRSNPGGGKGNAAVEPLRPGAESATYGSVSLSPGFAPDPHEVSITSGGSLNVRDMDLGSDCTGYATRTPDLIVNFAGSSDRLRFYFIGNGDTGLIVVPPSGGWECNDDSYSGTNPTVNIANARKGRYEIWVTSYSSDDSIRGTLYVTELDSRHPEQ